MNSRLHYIYDPLCGWCYGATHLVAAATAVEGLDLELHGGGLWPEPTTLPDDMRAYIKQADARVGAMNGVDYGEAYLNGLLFDPALVLESRPVTAAVLAAETLAEGAGVGMLRAIQAAHYVRGLHVVKPEVLLQLAEEIGLDGSSFEDAVGRTNVDEHMATTRKLMAKVGAAGFPTFVLEVDGQLYGVPHNQFAGNAQGFADWLAAASARQPEAGAH